MNSARCGSGDARPVCSGLAAIPVWLLAILALWLSGPAAHGQFMPRPTVIENVRIHTGDGEVIQRGTIIIRGSRIAAIGADIESPRRAVRIDGTGMHATPGLIDVLSMLAMPSGGSGGNNPAASVHHAFDRFDSRAIEEAVTNGVTTISISPAAHRGFGPGVSIIRLRPDGNGAFGEVLEPRIALTLNMRSDSDPIERLQLVDAVRSQLRDARDHEEALEIYEEELEEYLEKLRERREAEENETDQPNEGGNRARRGQRNEQPTDEEVKDEDDAPEKPSRPTPDPQKDALIKALNHDLPVRVHADRAEDILNALEIADEFGLKIILEGCAEAHLVANEIAAAGVPVILAARPTSDLPRRGAQLRTSRDAAATLDKAGVTWTLGSGASGGNDSRYLLFAAQMLMQQSRLEIDPIELVTRRAAEMLGIDDQLGRLAPGMQADIVLWSGDPGDPSSRVQRALIGGQMVYQRTEGDS